MQHCCLSGLPSVLIALALWDRTLTLAVMLIGEYPAASVYSLFSCWACAPTRLLKLVVRWRLSSVFWGGMFNSMASESELNRGSNIWMGGDKYLDSIRSTDFPWIPKSCTHYEPSVHATTPQVWRVLCQVHGPQPLHDSVVGPLDHLAGSKLVLSAENRHAYGW